MGATPSVQAAARSYSGIVKSPLSTQRTPTALKDITNYNNYYEFGTERMSPADCRKIPHASVDGQSRRHGQEAQRASISTHLLKLAPLEERIYRHRCVEGWSMVIPWVGFSLSALIKAGDPLASAKLCRIPDRCCDPKQMPNQKRDVLDWPYVEGLRMDEAMHPLTILASASMAKCCPTRTARRCAWWCPGSTDSRASKSIVKISFVDEAAADHLEHHGAGRIRLLLQRESQKSTIRAGARRASAASASSATSQDAHVQWLCRPGRKSLLRHGPAEKLLMKPLPEKFVSRIEGAGVPPLPWAGLRAHVEGIS